MFEEARALGCIICNKSWTGARLLEANIIEDPAQAECQRCKKGLLETSFHRYYGCEANADIDSHFVRKSHDIRHKAVISPELECLWYRGILPGGMMGEPI